MRGRRRELLEMVRGRDERELGVVGDKAVERGEEQLSTGEVEPRAEASRSRRRGRGTSARAIARACAPRASSRRTVVRRAERARARRAAPRRAPHRPERAAPRSTRSSAWRRCALLDREHRREAATGPRVHEANLLAQAKDVRAAERATKDLDAAAARKVDRARDGEERRLPRAVRSEERPPLARLPSSRSPRGSALAFRMPHASARRRRPTGGARALDPERLRRLHWLTD